MLFGGERQLDPRDLTLVADSSGVVYAGPDGVRRTLERHRDVTMRAGDGQRFAVIALENQADVHYAMPVRSMLYDALDYVDQVRKITQGYRESGEKLTGSELLSGLRKGDRLVPVVTIVLYWGASEDVYKRQDNVRLVGGGEHGLDGVVYHIAQADLRLLLAGV